MKENKKIVGRKELYPGHETYSLRVIIRKDKKKEMKAEIKAVQDKYKSL